MARGNRRSRRLLMIVLGGVFALVASGLAVIFVTGIGPYDLPTNSRQLDETIALSRSLGLPMTQAELIPDVPSDSENAAPLIIEEIRQMRGKSPDFRAVALRDPAAVADARTTISQENGRLDAIVAELAQKKGWHIARDYDLGPALLFPEYADLKNAVRLIAVRGTLRAQEGRFEAATNDFVAARDLGMRCSTEPTLIAMLVAIACDAIALALVENIADAAQSSPEALSTLERAIERTNQRVDVVQPLRGEFYLALSITRNFKQFGGYEVFTDPGSTRPLDPGSLQRSGLPRGLVERASMNKLAGAYNKVFSSFANEAPPHRGWGAVFDRETAAMESRFRASEILPKILLPVFSRADDTLARHDISQQIAIAYVRCLRHRAIHGRWPASLSEVEADFEDPFNPGSPIKAKFGQGELRVWSVGVDRVDDGGHIRQPEDQRDDTVYVWPVELRRRAQGSSGAARRP